MKYAVVSVQNTKIYLSSNTVIYTISGGNGIEDPPVPIPNTEVKLNCAEGTWLDTAWEIRSLPDFQKEKPSFVRRFFFFSYDLAYAKVMSFDLLRKVMSE